MMYKELQKLDVLSELELLSVHRTYRNKMTQYEKWDIFILDELLLVNITNTELQDIIEVLEKRYRVHSII